jgi:hypothetical protein
MVGYVQRSTFEETPMTEPEREMVTTLCALISDEKDPHVFSELLVELEALLEKISAQPPAQA